MSLKRAVEMFLEYQKHRKSRSDTTITTYRCAIERFIDHCGDIPLDSLTIRHIDAYAEHISKLGLSPKTVRNKLTPIRSMVKFLYSKELVDIRPESIDLPSVPEIEANFLSPDEQRAMIKACVNERERALVKFLLRSGVRVSELTNLHADDLYERSVIVRRGKGGKPRITFISPEAELAVRKYHQSLEYDPYWMFSGAGGRQLSRQYVSRTVSAIAKRAGVKKPVSPHTLRHTFATNLLQAGARVEDVQPLMGHANIRTTMIYMHFTNDYLKGRYDEIMKNSAITY